MPFKYSRNARDGKAGLWEITARRVHETNRGVLVAYGSIEAWLPKRAIQVAETKGGMVDIAMPEWLARKSGFLR